jgi:putative sterol carrier protein
MSLDPEHFFSRVLEAALNSNPRLAGELSGVDATAQIELREAPAGASDWYVRFRAGKAEVLRGQSRAPSFGLSMHYEDWRDLMEGAATVQACLIDGRLEVEGDLGKAIQIAPLLLGPSAD